MFICIIFGSTGVWRKYNWQSWWDSLLVLLNYRRSNIFWYRFETYWLTFNFANQTMNDCSERTIAFVLFWILAGMILPCSPENNVDNQDRDTFKFLVWCAASNVTFLSEWLKDKHIFLCALKCLEYQFLYIVFQKTKMPSYFIPRKHR